MCWTFSQRFTWWHLPEEYVYRQRVNSKAAAQKYTFQVMRICFSTNRTPDLNPIAINDKQINVVSHAKILGENISSDLQRNHHIAEVKAQMS